MNAIIELPLLPLRDVVVYPHMVIPLFVGREKSIEALEAAMSADKQILLLAQKNPADDDPAPEALYQVGTVASVLQLLKLPDGTVKVLVEGGQRGAVERFVAGSRAPAPSASVTVPAGDRRTLDLTDVDDNNGLVVSADASVVVVRSTVSDESVGLSRTLGSVLPGTASLLPPRERPVP